MQRVTIFWVKLNFQSINNSHYFISLAKPCYINFYIFISKHYYKIQNVACYGSYSLWNSITHLFFSLFFSVHIPVDVYVVYSILRLINHSSSLSHSGCRSWWICLGWFWSQPPRYCTSGQKHKNKNENLFYIFILSYKFTLIFTLRKLLCNTKYNIIFLENFLFPIIFFSWI